MRYPVISTDEVERLVTDLLGEHGDDVDRTRAVKWVGNGTDLDPDSLEALSQKLDELMAAEPDLEAKGARDRIEGKGSILVADALGELPLDVLDDPGFWRYVSLAHLWHFIHWRERATFDKGDYSTSRVYVDGKRYAECVPLRMFLRGRIAADAGDKDLAAAAPEATDLWRSHILRVRTSYTPDLAAALVRQQSDPDRRMATDPLRAQAKRINRVASNVVLAIYDQAAAEKLVAELAPDPG